MAGLLRNFDQFSFWIGFLAGTLFWWLWSRARPALSKYRENLKDRNTQARESLRLGVEFHYRNDVIRHVQSLHTASSLFSLEEIAIQPTILAPPAETAPGSDIAPVDLASRAIPYMPDYPEFGSHFGVPRLTFPEALSKGANLALMGEAGSGKSFALAYLAMQIAKLSPEAGSLADYVPVFLHAADLSLPLSEEVDPVHAISSLLYNKDLLSRKTIPRFPQFMSKVFREGRALLLLDGLDELPPDWIERASHYLHRLLEIYPRIRVIAAVSPDYYGRITSLGLAPVTLASWNREEKTAFFKKWGRLWETHIQPNIWSDGRPNNIEGGMLQSWIRSESKALTPFEYTLRAWALFAGDLPGPENSHAIDALISRLTPNAAAAETALERIATQMALTQNTAPHYYAATNWSLGKFEQYSEEELELQAREALEIEPKEPEEERVTGKVNRWTFQSLVEAGLLVRRQNNRIGFAQPALMGYYAARGLVVIGGGARLLEQLTWSGKVNTLHFLAGRVDITPIVKRMAEKSDYRRGLLASGRWLRNILDGSPSRIYIMRKLVGLLQDGEIPIPQRARSMAALVYSGDKSIPALCKKLLTHQDPVIRRLAALGLGIAGEARIEKDLTDLLADKAIEVRTAVCLALAGVGTREAIDTVASVLLHGDEDTQRAAAEALATQHVDGHALLQEAAEMEDLLVRRAAIYGLEKMDPQVALPVLEKLQLTDEQWIVRNVADEVIARIKNGTPLIPPPLPELDSVPWLIEFAGERGEGLPPGQAARQMLLQVLEHGNDEQIMAALDYLRRDAGKVFYLGTTTLLDNPSLDIREAALNTVWHMQAAGLADDYGVPARSVEPAKQPIDILSIET